MEYCLRDCTQLYEKFTSKVNRKSQSSAWKKIADELKEKENIDVPVDKLKQDVSNWIRRATVRLSEYFFRRQKTS